MSNAVSGGFRGPYPSGNIKYTKRSMVLFLRETSRPHIRSSSFQHAVVRNLNDKNLLLQKQLENIVREGKTYVLSPTLDSIDAEPL